jgi:hypothetical protein
MDDNAAMARFPRRPPFEKSRNFLSARLMREQRYVRRRRLAAMAP